LPSGWAMRSGPSGSLHRADLPISSGMEPSNEDRFPLLHILFFLGSFNGLIDFLIKFDRNECVVTIKNRLQRASLLGDADRCDTLDTAASHGTVLRFISSMTLAKAANNSSNVAAPVGSRSLRVRLMVSRTALMHRSL
jgi:hypothetical protein